MELQRGMSAVVGFIVLAAAISMTLACNAKNSGWGEPDAFIIPKISLPKPTLIPKLAAAFHDGKDSVRPVKHGKVLYHGNAGWGKGHGNSHAFQNGLGQGLDHGHYEYGYGVNSPYTHDFKNVYEKGSQYGVKGHYLVKEPNSFKSVNYDVGGLGGPAGFGGDHFGDYAPGFGKK